MSKDKKKKRIINKMKLTTGDESTLGNYLKLTSAIFGKDSGATKFLEDLIEKSILGENEAVLQDERQMIQLLKTLHEDKT